MSLQTNLKGRLRNTSLPKSHGLMPVFEAVVNSIHSIEDAEYDISQGEIRVEVIRSPQQQLEVGNRALDEIVGFIISDNGCGFTNTNFSSFETLDSEHKIDRGCRGVGRLMWLKAFQSAHISSRYIAEGNTERYKSFVFDEHKGVHSVQDNTSSFESTGTEIRLNNFKENFRKSCPKTTLKMANALLEHCLWYFVRSESCPNITIADQGELVSLYSLYDDYMREEAQHEEIIIADEPFELTHIKFRTSSGKKHNIAFCASSRLVKEEGIVGKLPGLHPRISDDNGDFIYSCYLSSPVLDEHARSERTSFDLAEHDEGLFADSEITLDQIRAAVISRSAIYLADSLGESLKTGKQRIDSYVAEQAPRYRSLLKHIPDEDLMVDSSISDRDLELHLHAKYSDFEKELLSEGHSVMVVKEDEQEQDYRERVSTYIEKTDDLKKSDLANYVAHRKVTLDLLSKAIERQEDGKYAREDLIHQLIMPMRADSSEVNQDACNLWLVDERLTFHDYLASDKPLSSMPILDTDSRKEPDLLALNTYDKALLVSDTKSLPLASITVIEIKRPMRNDAKAGEEKDPIEQALGYLKRVRNGKVQTPRGRTIPDSSNIPGYCYVICDLTPSIIERCELLTLTSTSDHLGYFGYNPNYKAYIEVISYDRLVNRAKERNKAFFDKLGLPTN